MQHKSQLYIFLAGVVFLSTMSMFLVYSNSKQDITVLGITLKKNNELIVDQFGIKQKNIPIAKKPPQQMLPSKTIDTTAKRFLLVGDSEVEGLRNPFYDYCKKNGHTLAAALCWYSSTDATYASNDTLKNIILQYKPNHIVFVIGLNQIYQSHFESSQKSITKILEIFKGIDYSWIGPANWVDDKGINALYQNEIDTGNFFLSKNLLLERGKDGRHPSVKANYIWMDSIAYWMQNKSVNRIKMNKPDSMEKVRHFKFIMLNAAKN